MTASAFFAVVGETKSYTYQALTGQGPGATVVPLATASTVQLVGLPTGPITGSASSPSNVVTMPVLPANLAVAGVFSVRTKITWGDGTTSYFPDGPAGSNYDVFTIWPV